MFQRVASPDMRLIIRGLFILVTIVGIGVGIVEHQMATLTQRPAQERWESTVVTTITNYLIPLPIKIEIDGSELEYWLTVWHRQFVEEAFTVKKVAGEYWSQVKPYIEAALLTLRIKTWQAIQQMNEYISEYR